MPYIMVSIIEEYGIRTMAAFLHYKDGEYFARIKFNDGIEAWDVGINTLTSFLLRYLDIANQVGIRFFITKEITDLWCRVVDDSDALVLCAQWDLFVKEDTQENTRL